jgi:CubicO group peptidase (beta-lactamase class C family)
LDFFPEHSIHNLDNDKKSITLGNLMSMTPGIDCEDTKVNPELDQTGDWVQYLLSRPMSSKPGTKWIYYSGTAHLLSAVLQKETGIGARTYANQNRFAPLGIPQLSKQDWRSDPHGITDGRAGLYLTLAISRSMVICT